jgi:uncharacterized damage-inducible protein DinB
MDTDFANIEGMFKTNTDIVKKAITEIPEVDWFRSPGDDSNHLMWVTGHVIWSRGNVLKSLNAQWTAPWLPVFARGATRAMEEQYPPVAEIQSAWNDVSTRLLDCLANAPAELLAKIAPQGPPSFDGKLSGLVAFLAFHETYHVGQISYLRKWLGHGQSVG